MTGLQTLRELRQKQSKQRSQTPMPSAVETPVLDSTKPSTPPLSTTTASTEPVKSYDEQIKALESEQRKLGLNTRTLDVSTGQANFDKYAELETEINRLKAQRGDNGLNVGESFLYGAGKTAEGLAGVANTAVFAPAQFLYGGLGAVTGLFGDNAVSDWFYEQSRKSAESDLFGENKLSEALESRYGEKLSDADRTVGGIVKSGSEMLGSVAVGNIAGAALGTSSALAGATKTVDPSIISRGTFTANAYRGAVNEALSEGASIEDATAYGALAATVSTAVESIADGIPGLNNPSSITSKMFNKLKNTPQALRTLANIAGEGGEEVVEEIITPYIKRIAYNPEAEAATLDELVLAFTSGTVLSGLMQGGAGIAGRLTDITTRTPQTQQASAAQDVPANIKAPSEPVEAPTSPVAATSQPPSVVQPQTVETQQTQAESATQINEEPIAEVKPLTEGEVLEQQLNALREEQKSLVEQLETPFAIDNETENQRLENRLTKVNADIDSLVAQESNAAVKTSLQKIINNLTQYRRSDLESLAEQIGNGNWDGYEELTRSELENQLRDAINERAENLSDLEVQSPKYGLFVRPVESITAQPTQQTPQEVNPIVDVATQPTAENPLVPEGSVGAMRSQHRLLPSKVFTNTFANSGIFTDEELASVPKENTLYSEITEAQSQAGARTRLALFGYTSEMYELMSRDGWGSEDLDVAMAIQNKLVEDARADYAERLKTYMLDYADVLESGEMTQADVEAMARADSYSVSDGWEVYVKSKGTEAGQFIQAFAKYTRDLLKTNPQLALKTVQENIAKMNKEGAERFGKKWKDFELTAEEIASFENITPGDGDAVLEAMENIERRIARFYPTTPAEKLVEYTHLMMLLNPKTQGRNFISNVFTAPVEIIANKLSGIVQAIALEKGDRTQAVFVSKQAKDIAKQGWEEYGDVLTGTSKYMLGTDLARYGLKNKEIFKKRWYSIATHVANLGIEAYNKATGNNVASLDKPVMEYVRDFTYWLLSDVGDNPFVKQQFIHRLASYADAQGITSYEQVTPEMIEVASKAALRATFKNDNAIASAINKLKRAGGGTQLFAELVAPFTKTPTNVLTVGAENSPIGIATAIYKHLRNTNKTSATQFIDELSHGLTGTALFSLGLVLRAIGVLTGSRDKDKDKAALDKATGNAPYSIFGKWTYDWAQPMSLPIIMGATAYDVFAEDTDPLTGALNVASEVGDTFLDMSFARSMSDIFTDYDGPVAGFMKELSEFPLRGIPSVLRQFAQAGDDTVRSTYANNLPDALANQALSQIPGASESLPPSVNVKGEENKRIENDILRGLYSFLSPANYTGGERSEVDEEIYRLFEATGSKTVFPSVATRTALGEKMTGKELAQFQTTSGQTAEELRAVLMESTEYSKLTDEQKVKLFEATMQYGTDTAKRELAASRGVEYSSDWDDETEYTSEELAKVLAYKRILADLKKTNGQENKALNALRSDYTAMSDTEKSTLADALGEKTLDRVMQAVMAGISSEKYFTWKNKLSEYNKTIKGSEASKTWRKELFYDYSLTTNQKSLLDNLLVSDGFYISKESEVDYNGWDNFTLSQMSDSAQSSYTEHAKGIVDADTFEDVYTFKNKQSTDDNGKPREKTLNYIYSLGLDRHKMDALYLALGYSEKTISTAPWR